MCRRDSDRLQACPHGGGHVQTWPGAMGASRGPGFATWAIRRGKQGALIELRLVAFWACWWGMIAQASGNRDGPTPRSPPGSRRGASMLVTRAEGERATARRADVIWAAYKPAPAGAFTVVTVFMARGEAEIPRSVTFPAATTRPRPARPAAAAASCG